MFKKILKFGGTSVGTPKAIKKVGKIVKESSSQKGEIAVVVSAFSGVTDGLLKCAHLAEKKEKKLSDEVSLLKERHKEVVRLLLSPKKRKETFQVIEKLFDELKEVLQKIEEKGLTAKDLDLVASFGERLSASIVASYIKDGYFVDARELVKTDDNFLNASVKFKLTNRNIKRFFVDKKGTPVITGFIGSTQKGETTTLGRGSSDYMASIFGAALDAETVEIWGDVDGIMSADPKLVKTAQVLPQISYEEAIEMAYFGAKVIHPVTMVPLIKKNIPILIKNTFNSTASGTLISNKTIKSFSPIKAITSIDKVALINVIGVTLVGIPGSASRVLQLIREKKINILLVTQGSSDHAICFVVKEEELLMITDALKKEFADEIKLGEVSLEVISDQSIVTVIGEKMRGTPGIAGRMFKVLGDNNVNISVIAQGGSEINISFTVARNHKVKALNLVHDEFLFDGIKNIFLVGTGNIGGILLDQIKKLKNKKLRVCGIINQDNMLMGEERIDLNGWDKKLKRGASANLENFLSWSKSVYSSNKIFVDCTASEQVAEKYINLAQNGFNIVTPNKKFNVLLTEQYEKLREVLRKTKKKFLYEANVGAGLPVISTVWDLLKSGDEIVKIEGIFSGTLSYIFNSFDGKKPFSEIVKNARELGYTEPDPREDLSGQDVARKLLVLAREIGYKLELKNVKVESLVPKNLRKLKTADDFLNKLKEYDAKFSHLVLEAKKANKVLRFVAKLERGRAQANLLPVSLDDPLAKTSGANNIFAFYTKRYKSPLVVEGPGAGAEVTAGGVLADILKI